MSRDYAKRPRKSRNTNKPAPRKKAAQKKPLSPFFVFFAGMFLTLVALLIWGVWKKPDLLKELMGTEPVVTTTVKESAPPEPDRITENEPQFTYHETLTGKEVDVNTTPTQESQGNKNLILQCATFKDRENAETMEAELAFLGFQANVVEGDGRFKIRFGPYTTKRAAESMRHKLQDNGIQGCRIW